MVIETHLGYAVVLSDDGRFKKVANFNYEVGQMVDNVFDMKKPEGNFFSTNTFKAALTLVSALAVLVVALFMNRPTTPTYFASVLLKINPEVRIYINQENDVVNIEGVNPDGEALIQGYVYEDKKLDPVMDELVDLAIDLGYLYDGGEVNITFDGDEETWLIDATTNMKNHVQQSIHSKVSATIIVGDTLTNNYELVIPIDSGTFPDHEESDYDDNEYGDQESDYDESDYQTDSPYEDSPYDDDVNDSPYEDSPYDDSPYEDDVEDSPYDDSPYDDDVEDSPYDDSLYDESPYDDSDYD